MVKSKSPKVFSYFLFMQEQRKKVPGWANKTNNELQALCDPLWRKLDKEEKDKYKQMKKAYKEKERNETEEKFASLMHTGSKTSVVVGHVEKPDIVWVVKTKDMDFVQNQLTNITMVPIDVVKVGTVAACKFSEDGVVYRAQVLSMENINEVVIRYMEFGNTEMVDQKELCHLPLSLSKVGPMAVKVKLVGMEGVKNSEKNRLKVEKKLDVDNLEVSVDKEWGATFYSSGIALRLKGSKAERNEINPIEETSRNQDEGRSEVGADLVLVGNVKGAVDESGAEGFDSLNEDSNSNDEIVKMVDGENNFEACDEIYHVADIVHVSIDGQDEASLGKSSFSAETDSGVGISMTMESLGIGSECQANDIEDNNDGAGKLDKNVVRGEASKLIKTDLSFNETKAAGVEDYEKIIDDRKKDRVVGVSRRKKGQSTIVVKSRDIRSKKIVNRTKKREVESGWKVNDAVVAQWEDGVWRQGVVHEVIDGMAFVVSKEEMVKATKVTLAKLRNAAIPVDVLNMLEEELVSGNGNDSSTDENSSIISGCDETELNYSEELDNLLNLLPLIDIETLASSWCTDLISSLVLVIPTLPVYQLDVLVESMIVHDLLIPAALHSQTSLVARELVRSVMKSTSDKRGQVLSSLAMHADELQLNVWGKEVLKTLQGYF